MSNPFAVELPLFFAMSNTGAFLLDANPPSEIIMPLFSTMELCENYIVDTPGMRVAHINDWKGVVAMLSVLKKNKVTHVRLNPARLESAHRVYRLDGFLEHAQSKAGEIPESE